MKVLITGYEVAPFFKRGGLGDVMGSLPKALVKIGVDCRVVVPYYTEMQGSISSKRIGEFHVYFEDKEEKIGVYESRLPNSNCPVYFLSNSPFFSYGKHKGINGRIDQFAFFSLAVARFIHHLSERHKWTADIVHCNDWHTALVPLILKNKIKLSIPTILTIHNLAYQGFGSRKVLDLLHMKDEETKELKRGEPMTRINILGDGIVNATRVSTVSPTYAKEIVQTEHDHSPISPFLLKREHESLGGDGKIIGILNGIDYDIWDPATDDFIFHKYDVNNWAVGKKDNKDDLLKSLGLENKSSTESVLDKPTFCFVGRMANQKGLDVLIKAIHRIAHLNVNMIILGSGNLKIQKKVLNTAKKYPFVKAEVVYNEDLAHKIYAGSDYIIIPSRYEPCGLIQMIAMRYGTIPIASNTGGLKDSILNGKNGFLFKKSSVRALVKTINKAAAVYKERNRHARMVNRAMRKDFSWDKSAKLYRKLYKEMIDNK